MRCQGSAQSLGPHSDDASDEPPLHGLFLFVLVAFSILSLSVHVVCRGNFLSRLSLLMLFAVVILLSSLSLSLSLSLSVDVVCCGKKYRSLALSLVFLPVGSRVAAGLGRGMARSRFWSSP